MTTSEITPEQLAALNLAAERDRDAQNFRSSTLSFLQKGGSVEQLHTAIDAGAEDYSDFLAAQAAEAAADPQEDPQEEQDDITQ